MKRIIQNIFLLFIIIFFSGCLKVNTNIIVNKDGSGIIEETLLISKAVVEMMNEFGTSFGDSTVLKNKFKVYDPEELKNKADRYGKGAKFKTASPYEKEGWEGYKAQYSFNDVNTIHLDIGKKDEIPFDNGAMSDEVVETPKLIEFNLRKGNPAELTITMPPKDVSEPKDENSTTVETSEDTTGSAMLEQAVSMFAEMEMSSSVKINGTIRETNASFVKDSTITLFYINFASVIKNANDFKAIEPLIRTESLEEMKKLMGKFDGIKIELEDKVKIKFD
jgi:hypothetical protein